MQIWTLLISPTYSLFQSQCTTDRNSTQDKKSCYNMCSFKHNLNVLFLDHNILITHQGSTKVLTQLCKI